MIHVSFRLQSQACLEAEVRLDVHSPMELGDQGFIEDLLYGHFVSFAPGHCDARIEVIDLGCPKSHCLQVLLTATLYLET